VQNCVDTGPLKVTVSAQVGPQKVYIWSGRQQDLFQKYADKRTKTIEKITSSLEDLKEDFDM